MKRTALATASALTLAAVLTACGGDDDADAKPENSPSSPQAKQLTPEQQLAKLMVTSAEADGYNVEEPGKEFVFAKSQDEVSVDKPECAPLAYAMNQLPLGEPQADLTRVTSQAYGKPFTYVTLAAYAPGKAEKALTGLSEAVNACGAGFTATGGSGDVSPYDTVTTEKGMTPGSVAFRSTMTFRGTPHTLHTEAVRHDDVIAVYFAVNGLAIAESRPSDAKLAAAVVTAQNGKLG
jgi:hypothetical protein